METTIEYRLAELELKLIGAQSLFGTSSNDNDLVLRLDKLSLAADAADTRGKILSSPESTSSTSSSNTEAVLTKRSALHEDCCAIEHLLSELNISPLAGPRTAYSNGNGINSSALLYRRMEILASCETMKRDMDLLAMIRELLSIGTKTEFASGIVSTGGDSKSVDSLSAKSRVVNCPIISSERYNLPSTPDAIQKLDKVTLRLDALIERCVMVSQRADHMLNAYGKIMLALSEKLVLVEEQMLKCIHEGGSTAA